MKFYFVDDDKNIRTILWANVAAPPETGMMPWKM